MQSSGSAEIARLEALARVERTPCGEGSVVWHIWGEGRPLLLLHGGSGSWSHWIRNIPVLAGKGFRVIVPDLPGNGDSASPPDGQDADVLPRWLESGLESLLGGPSALDVMAFSFGTLVATLLAHQYPSRVSRLILVGPPIVPNQSASAVGIRSWRDQPAGPLRDAIHRHNLAAFMLEHPASIDDLALRVHAKNVERDRLTKRRLTQTSLMHDTIITLAQPIDMIAGECDVLYRGKHERLEQALKTIPALRSFTWLEDAGHWVPFESAERFNQRALELLL